jgi:hypothetical protein
MRVALGVGEVAVMYLVQVRFMWIDGFGGDAREGFQRKVGVLFFGWVVRKLTSWRVGERYFGMFVGGVDC